MTLNLCPSHLQAYAPALLSALNTPWDLSLLGCFFPCYPHAHQRCQCLWGACPASFHFQAPTTPPPHTQCHLLYQILQWRSVMDTHLAFSATQQLLNMRTLGNVLGRLAMSCLIPRQVGIGYSQLVTGWLVTALGWPLRCTQGRPWVERQVLEDRGVPQISLLVKRIGEESGVQTTGGRSSGVQHWGPFACSAIFGQGATGWALSSHACTRIWTLCGIWPGCLWAILIYSFHQFIFCLDYLKELSSAKNTDWGGHPLLGVPTDTWTSPTLHLVSSPS